MSMLPVNTSPPRNDPELRPTRLKRLVARLVRRRWPIARGLSLAGGLALGGWAAATVLPAAPFLAIDDIVVHGNERLSEGEVLALVSGLRGASILSVDLEEHRRRLSASPWLVGGALRRRLPSTVEVFVAERTPIALARFGGRLFLIDAAGAIVDGHGPRFAELDFPIVDGLGAGDGAAAAHPRADARGADNGSGGSEGAAESVDPRRMALAVRLLRELSSEPATLAAVSQIDVADPDDAVVLLNDDVVLLHLGTERFLARLRLYAELAPVLREQVADIDEVDLRFDPRVYVRPRTEARGSGDWAARASGGSAAAAGVLALR